MRWQQGCLVWRLATLWLLCLQAKTEPTTERLAQMCIPVVTGKPAGFCRGIANDAKEGKPLK